MLQTLSGLIFVSVIVSLVPGRQWIGWITWLRVWWLGRILMLSYQYSRFIIEYRA